MSHIMRSVGSIPLVPTDVGRDGKLPTGTDCVVGGRHYRLLITVRQGSSRLRARWHQWQEHNPLVQLHVVQQHGEPDERGRYHTVSYDCVLPAGIDPAVLDQLKTAVFVESWQYVMSGGVSLRAKGSGPEAKRRRPVLLPEDAAKSQKYAKPVRKGKWRGDYVVTPEDYASCLGMRANRHA